MLLEHGCLDLMCQPQKLLTFWTSEPQVAYKMVAYIKKSVPSTNKLNDQIYAQVR